MDIPRDKSTVPRRAMHVENLKAIVHELEVAIVRKDRNVEGKPINSH